MMTRFESNSRHVMRTVEQAFAGWTVVRDLVDPAIPLLNVRIVVHDGGEHGAHRTPVRYIAPDASRIIMQSPGSIAISDPERRESVAYVTTTFAADRDHFRGAMIEAATSALIAHFDRHPLHASAVAHNGRAVLLVGPSGAGKSTLAHRAHDAGFDALSEDGVWISLEPALRVWGWPGYARLLPGTGSEKIVVPLAATRACYTADDAIVCLLARGERAALEALSPDVVAAELRRDVAPGFDRFPARHERVSLALASRGGWRLTLSADPRDALPLLSRLLSSH